jgi:hypothetical protein
MRRLAILALSAVLVTSAASAALYYSTRDAGDQQLSGALRSLGYLPINPPSNLMNLGSLYYVDPQVKFFKTICTADEQDLNGAVIKSPSTRTLADELDSGRFSLGLKLGAGTASSGGGNLADNFVRKVHYSLTDVQLYEIPLGANQRIYSKLMSRPECNDAVMANIFAGGFVCQGQQIMEATVEYDLRIGGGTSVSATADASELAKAIKVTAHPSSDVQLTERAGRLVTGSALKYGIAMNPTCMAPPHARFQRILPKTRFDRFMNFVKFRLVEPVLPGT